MPVLEPRFMPLTTRSGRLFLRRWQRESLMQSAGVPPTARPKGWLLISVGVTFRGSVRVMA